LRRRLRRVRHSRLPGKKGNKKGKKQEKKKTAPITEIKTGVRERTPRLKTGVRERTPRLSLRPGRETCQKNKKTRRSVPSTHHILLGVDFRPKRRKSTPRRMLVRRPPKNYQIENRK
jgi:hypothetical protein